MDKPIFPTQSIAQLEQAVGEQLRPRNGDDVINLKPDINNEVLDNLQRLHHPSTTSTKDRT